MILIIIIIIIIVFNIIFIFVCVFVNRLGYVTLFWIENVLASKDDYGYAFENEIYDCIWISDCREF